MDEKPVTALPGIGDAFGDRLRDGGFTMATEVLEKYRALHQNRERFITWLRGACEAEPQHRRHIEACYDALREWCSQFD